MFEIFYILKGKAEFVVNKEKVEVGKEDCIILEPGDLHSQSNPYEKDVVWTYFCIATD